MAVHPETTDALYSDRIRLLQNDPERYFELFPRIKFGFQPLDSDSDSDD